MALGSESEIRFEENGELGIVTFNRARDLNALSIEMIRLFSAALKRWSARDSRVQAVVVTATGRAFSVGGDVKAVRAAVLSARQGRSSAEVPEVFFGEEYLLARQLYHFPKPVVMFLSGLAIGNLLGLAGSRVYRVVTERTLFAVPHCAIGFFPGCGSALAFNACPGRLGYYLALTGTRMQAAEMLAARLATHYVSTAQVRPCIERIGAKLSGVRNAADAERAVTQILGTSLDLPETGNSLNNVSFIIDEHFSKSTMAEIIDSLRRSGSGWAMDTIRTLSGRCPLSLEVTLQHLIRAENMGFDAAIEQDYRIARALVARDDFVEGVRAVLIDKDNAPEWKPGSIGEIDRETIAAVFRPDGKTLARL